MWKRHRFANWSMIMSQAKATRLQDIKSKGACSFLGCNLHNQHWNFLPQRRLKNFIILSSQYAASYKMCNAKIKFYPCEHEQIVFTWCKKAKTENGKKIPCEGFNQASTRKFRVREACHMPGCVWWIRFQGVEWRCGKCGGGPNTKGFCEQRVACDGWQNPATGEWTTTQRCLALCTETCSEYCE
jgi:hypothetical protein